MRSIWGARFSLGPVPQWVNMLLPAWLFVVVLTDNLNTPLMVNYLWYKFYTRETHETALTGLIFIPVSLKLSVFSGALV